MTQYTIPFTSDQCRKENVDLLGGKCASLGELTSVGARVPPGFAVTTEFYDEFLEQSGLDSVIKDRFSEGDFSELEDAREASKDIQSWISDEEFPSHLKTEISEAWEKLLEETESDVTDLSVAVRSSATAEDLPDASFAGQQDTYLGVSSLDTVEQRIRDCIASLFTARAISYREENGFTHTDVKISVGVQRMVDARSSGVMFTLNPANGDRSKVRIESNWGLGEPVVSGEVTPDSFLVEKPLYRIGDRDVPEKSMKAVLTDSGIEEVTPEQGEKEASSLTDEEIAELTERGKELERSFGNPQDIEWAIEEDDNGSRIFILQSRPETAWAETNQDEHETEDQSDVSDNSSAEFLLSNVSNM